MTTPLAYTSSDVESRVGQARLETTLMHLEKTMTEGFKRLELTMTNRDTKSEETEERVSSLEKRMDKIYWLAGLAVSIGTPLMMALSKVVFAKFGL